VETADDILEALAGQLRRPLKDDPTSGYEEGISSDSLRDEELAMARQAVLELLGTVPVAVDEVIRQCQISPPAVYMVLLELELASRLERHPGNRVSLVADIDGAGN
jgi:DNA processing protein